MKLELGAVDIQGCVDVRISNPTARHERVLGAEMLSHSGEVLWRASEPAYVLAWSHRMLSPSLCPPSIARGGHPAV